MNKSFKRVALMGRRRASKIPETVLRLRDFLKTLAVEVVIEYHTGVAIEETELPLIDPSELSKHCDLIILVGGDGSMINAAHIAVKQDLPVVGINRGRTGFLTDIHPDEEKKLAEVISGKYKCEERSLLEMTLTSQTETIKRIALNDVVLFPGAAAHMIDFELRINREFVCTFRADGMIAATPTGSTAYALSAGGPILQPDLNAIVLVPMFPHSLSSRPIVIPGNETVELSIDPHNDIESFVSTDGQDKIAVTASHTLSIARYEKNLRLIHPTDYDYFATLREKLGWNHYKIRSAC